MATNGSARPRVSVAWNFFKRLNVHEAECVICHQIFRMPASGTTSNLLNHARDRHGNVFYQFQANENAEDSYSQSTMADKSCYMGAGGYGSGYQLGQGTNYDIGGHDVKIDPQNEEVVAPQQLLERLTAVINQENAQNREELREIKQEPSTSEDNVFDAQNFTIRNVETVDIQAQPSTSNSWSDVAGQLMVRAPKRPEPMPDIMNVLEKEDGWQAKKPKTRPNKYSLEMLMGKSADQYQALGQFVTSELRAASTKNLSAVTLCSLKIQEALLEMKKRLIEEATSAL